MLQTVDIAPRRLDDYRGVIGSDAFDELRALARHCAARGSSKSTRRRTVGLVDGATCGLLFGWLYNAFAGGWTRVASR